jgi:hypothetical protein
MQRKTNDDTKKGLGVILCMYNIKDVIELGTNMMPNKILSDTKRLSMMGVNK